MLDDYNVTLGKKRVKNPILKLVLFIFMYIFGMILFVLSIPFAMLAIKYGKATRVPGERKTVYSLWGFKATISD